MLGFVLKIISRDSVNEMPLCVPFLVWFNEEWLLGHLPICRIIINFIYVLIVNGGGFGCVLLVIAVKSSLCPSSNVLILLKSMQGFSH